jgi:hypothetical protein
MELLLGWHSLHDQPKWTAETTSAKGDAKERSFKLHLPLPQVTA